VRLNLGVAVIREPNEKDKRLSDQIFVNSQMWSEKGAILEALAVKGNGNPYIDA
jgi:hypothetical protein